MHHLVGLVHLHLTTERVVQSTHRAWKWRPELHLSAAGGQEDVGREGKEENGFACAWFDTEELFPVI